MFSIAEQLRSAMALHQRGELSQAQAIYEKVLRLKPRDANALHLLGIIASQQGQFAQAVALIDRALASSPGNAAFYANRGIAFQELKNFEAALADYSKAISIRPDFATAYNNRGVAHRELKKIETAVADFNKAISLQPNYAEAYNNRGVAHRELRKLDAAITDYSKAISIRRGYAEAYNNRGVAQQELGNSEAAISDFDKAISINPYFAEAYSNRGNALRELRKLEAAMPDFDKAIDLKPDYTEAYNNRGLAHTELKKLNIAVADFDKAISFKPNHAEAYNNRGIALRGLGHYKAAITDFDRAVAMKPDYAEAHSNRANTLRELSKYKAALAGFETAISIKPDYAEAYNNRGLALQEIGEVGAAIADFDKAIALKDDYAEAYWNKALASLLCADFETGFELYEWRWKNPHLNMRPRPFTQPLWLGQEPLHGKKILLLSEQGLGDTIQFCRYASLLAGVGAQVVFEVPQTLVGLLQSLDGAPQIVARGEPLPDFDFYCPLLSLPLRFGTRIHSIPSLTPYLHADPAKTQYWNERVGERKRLKVGIVWSGGFRPDQPEIRAVNERRNVPLDMFADALSAIDVDFFSLQKGEPAESEIRHREAEYWHRGNLRNFTDEIRDFSDTAALIANLDLVISVDTSTAHLAAALNKPTWILNRFDTCWRWLLNREDSPWYPSVNLYRQDESQSWYPVLHRVAADLAQYANEYQEEWLANPFGRSWRRAGEIEVSPAPSKVPAAVKERGQSQTRVVETQKVEN
jgi:tetratricopeptide (TPR) repeat protein